eukprot:613092-Pelagomonas_calceolata.AAC.4
MLQAATRDVSLRGQQKSSHSLFSPEMAWVSAIDHSYLFQSHPFLRQLNRLSQASASASLQVLWQRKSSDDLLYVFLVLINEYVSPVKE